VPSADDFPVLGGTGTATPPLGHHAWGAGGATGAQVLKASLAKAAGESAGAGGKAHEEVQVGGSGEANGEVQHEVEIAA
jgi:hypothetical protein